MPIATRSSNITTALSHSHEDLGHGQAFGIGEALHRRQRKHTQPDRLMIQEYLHIPKLMNKILAWKQMHAHMNKYPPPV